MNVYDFDKTICQDDTETDFFFYELKHRPINWLLILFYLIIQLIYKLKIIDEKTWRHHLYLTLKFIKNIDQEVIVFWKQRKHKVLDWYKKVQKEDDVIISATPRFLIEPILIALNIKHYIVSEFDLNKRSFIGEINAGEEKLIRFNRAYPNDTIDNFYTDSMRDLPLLLKAKNGFIVNKNYQIEPFNNKN